MAELTKEQQAAKEERELLEAKKQALIDEGAEKSKILEINRQLAESSERLAAAFKQEATHRASLSRETERATEKQKKHNEELERGKKVTDDFDNALKRNIKTFTGITDASDTLVGSFVNLAKEQGGVSAAFKRMTEVIGETVTATSMATSVFAKFAEGSVTMAFALDSATAGFSKATGLGKTFNSQIIDLERSNRQFGVSAEDSAQAFNSLVDGLSGFTLMDQDVQSALATEVAQLSELGVAAADSTGAFQSLTKTFGFTQQESMGLVQETEKLAGELGISLGQAINDLNAAAPKLAQLSRDQLIPAFKELSKQAIETGIAVDGLIGIAERFDTFDEAATAAGNLNAVLGTQAFDTTALLEAQLEGPQAVTALLTEQLQSSVGSFDDLTTFQKQAVANAAGLSTAELKNLMNAEEMTEEQKRQADEREKNLKTAMDMKAELMALAAELTVALQPVFNFFKSIVSFIATISRTVRELLGGGGAGSLASAAVMIGGGALVGKIVSATMKKIGIKGKAKGTKDSPFFVRVLDSMLGTGASEGEGGILDKMSRKLKDKASPLLQKFGFGVKKDAAGRFRDARGRFTSAPKFDIPGKFGDLTTSMKGRLGNLGGSLRGRLGNLGGSLRGRLGGALGKLTGGGAGGFLKGAFGKLTGGGAGGLLKGALGKLGGGKLLAKLGSRAIPGLGQAMMAFDGVKFLGPKLLKGVKFLGPKLLGGVKKFGGATLGLLNKAGGGLKKLGVSAAKRTFGLLKRLTPFSAAKSIGRGLKKLKFWNEGTDATPSLGSNQIQIAGDGGPNAEPEMIVPPPKSSVINNANLTNALEGMANGDGGGNAQMASAINNLGVKLDTLITEVRNLNNRPIETTAVIGKKDFAREVNGHFGRSGVSPATSAV